MLPDMTITGCSLADTTYQVDPRFDPRAPCWNITRIRRDANLGLFGPPTNRRIVEIRPMTPEEQDNIDLDKVQVLMRMPDVLLEPLLQVEYYNHQDQLYRVIADGNHRLDAKRALGHEYWQSYVVPVVLETNYRVRAFVEGKEVPLPY